MSEGVDKTTRVEIDRITAERIHAGHHAVNLPYQDAKTANTMANTLREMGYEATALPLHPNDPHNSLYDINVPGDDLVRLKTWLKSHGKEVIDAALNSFDQAGKYVPKQFYKPAAAVITLGTAMNEASASTGTLTDKAGVFAKEATAEFGGKAAIAMAVGDYDKAQREFADLFVPGADQILRSKEVQAVIDALPEDKTILASLQSDIKRAPIDRHLAEYQIHYLNAKENGNVIDGVSVASTMTSLAEMKVKLEEQWKVDAETFTAATKNPDTNWAQFKIDHPQLAIQADLHTAAQASGHPQAFIARVDEIIANNTGKGTPMQPIAEQLRQLQPQANIDSQAASR